MEELPGMGTACSDLNVGDSSGSLAKNRLECGRMGSEEWMFRNQSQTQVRRNGSLTQGIGWGDGQILEIMYTEEGEGDGKNTLIYHVLCVSHLTFKAYSSSLMWFVLLGESLKIQLLSHIRLCDSMDCSQPGSSVYEISQARILEWVVISFSGGSFQARDWTSVSCIAGDFFTAEPPGEPQ